MQTFLPYADFARSAACLDRQRLGKQRVECMQILQSLRIGGGWSNHPAVKMWCGYEKSLENYAAATVSEWVRRGYKNNMLFRIFGPGDYENPPWLGDEAFHAAHRAALLAKNPEWYGQWGWTEEPVINYIWPSAA